MEATEHTEFDKIRGCDIYWLMKQNPECNLAIMTDTIVPGWDAANWNTVDPNTLPLFDSSLTDAHVNLKFDFSYRSPAHICGFKVTTLQHKITRSVCETEFAALLNTIQPNWELANRKTCKFLVSDVDELDPAQINCTAVTETQTANVECCYFAYGDRYRMNQKLRHSVYNNLIKPRANFKHNQVFKKSRLDNISQFILQTVHAHCNMDYQTCSLPLGYNFGDHTANTPESWEWTDGYGRDNLQSDFSNETLGEGLEMKAAGTCTCPDGGVYNVAVPWPTTKLSCSTGEEVVERCYNGAYSCIEPSIMNQNDPYFAVTCGNRHYHTPEMMTEIMVEMDDTNPDHFYGISFKLRFQEIPIAWGDVTRETVVGRFEMSFNYNPLGGCRNTAGELISSSHCNPWTRNISSAWQFKVYNAYTDERVHDAANYSDLMIGMDPEFCNLTYKPLDVSRIILKCNLQKQLMTTITTKIWHEKLAYDLQSIIDNNLMTLDWHKNPDTAGPVYELNDTADAYKLDVHGNKLEVFYKDGDMWVTNPAFDVNEPETITNRPYTKDALGQPINDVAGTITPTTMVANSANPYLKNLTKFNTDVSNFYIKYRASNAEQGHIPHCLKKHLTHRKMDFYCLTAYGERIDTEHFDQAEQDEIVAQMIAHFADSADMEHAFTSDGAYIRTASVTRTGEGENTEAVATDVAQEFVDPNDRVKANTEDFTDEANITEDTG